MTTYTITTAVNIDSLASKAGNDTYNINGGYLSVDQDSRYGTNSTTSATLGAITLSATLGGTIEFNATKVRIIPYDGGSGVVPASNTTIAGAAGSGKLIGVYSALNVAPTAAAAAMPASGYIKIKQWNDGAYVDNESLSGITATVNGTDRVGWIEIVGADTGTATVNRLNTFKVRGEWYEFDTQTSGTRTTTYQLPSNGSAVVYHPGVWVETSPSSGTYEFYPCAGSRTALAANIGTEAARGKYCWISTAGLVMFGHDGTNSTGGYCPVSGCKIRVPNIFFVTATVAAPTVNVLPNATLATRYDFTATGGGAIDIDKAAMNWYLSLTQAYSVALSNSSFMTAITINEIAAPMTISNIGIGQEAANTQIGLTMTLCFAGGTITDCIVSRAAQAGSGAYVVSISGIYGFTFNNLQMLSLTYRGHATTGSATITRADQCTFNDPVLLGGRVLLTTCTNCSFNDTVYIDDPATTTKTTVSHYVYVLGTKCATCTFNGVTFGELPLVQPYAGLFNIGAAGCSDIYIRSIGTYNSPLDLGYSGFDVPWSRVTTTATVYHSGHIMKSGDIFYALRSDNLSAVTVGSKTITTTPTATGFTFACLNAGATTGTINYYATMAASLLVLDAGAAANDVRMQQVYTHHNRSVPYSSDNSTKNILIENVHADPVISAPLHPSLNQEVKGLRATPALTAQTSVYGTHFIDYFTRELPTGITSDIPWSRTTTTATGICPGHNLVTSDLINVEVSSSAAAIITGQKTVTVLDSSKFTFTCLNAGNATGTLSYSPLASRLAIQMNESTADTVDVYSLSGSSSFTSAGGLVMTGRYVDTAIFTTPDYVLGHTGFAWAEPVMGGGTLTGFNIYYQIDKNDGAGYSDWRNLSYVRGGAGGSNGSTTVTVLNTSGINTGDYVWGTNISPYAYVTDITNGTTLGVSRPNIGTVSANLRFGYLYNETGIDPNLGFKQKIKIVSNQTGSTAITSLYMFTMSSEASRAAQYPLDTTDASLSLINLVSGTEIHVYNTSNDLELASTEATTGSTFSYNYTWTGVDNTAYITVLKTGYQWIRYSDQTLGQAGLTIPVFQSIDRNYRNP